MQPTLAHFKALADETRLRLVHILHTHELSVNELVGILDMGQSRVSRHLKILSNTGLLQSRRDGLWVFYSVAKAGPEAAFVKAVLPFVTLTPQLRQDIELAERCLEERARKTRQFFNTIAEDWDALNSSILGDFDLPAAVAAAVPASCALAVDLGCGTGAVLARLLAVAQGVVGVDGSPRMLDMARRRFSALDVPVHAPTLSGGETVGHTPARAGEQRVSLRIGELDHLPLRDGEADFACINLVLHHLSEPMAALAEIRRILRPGGLLLVADFDKHDNEGMREIYGDRWLGFDEATLRSLLADAGFRVRGITPHTVEKRLTLLLVTAQTC